MTTESPPSGRGLAAWALPLRGDGAGLWGNSAFLRLWLANAIDDFGTQISGLAVPLTAALVLGAGPVEMGMLAAAQRLPYFAFGLLAGVLVDRRSKQRLMTLVNWLRAGLLALIPLTALLGGLQLELLYLVVLGVGTCGVIFDVAYVSWLPTLVPRAQLHDANGKMESTFAVGQAAGPGIAGLLIGAVSAPFAIAVDAASFLASAFVIRGIRPPHPPEPADPEPGPAERGASIALCSFLRDIVDGLRVVWGDAFLRPTVLCSATVSLFGYAFLAVYILFLVTELGLSPGGIGIVLAAGGIGAVVGSAATVRLSDRFGFGPTMIWAQIVFAVTGITVPVAVLVPAIAVPMLAASEFLQYGALAVFSIGALSLRQVRVIPALQGRAAATARTATSGAALAGSVLGGLLGGWIGLGPTLIVGVVGMGLGCVVVIVSPLRNLARLTDAAVSS